MERLDDHRHAVRLQRIHEGGRDLLRQPLLDLQPPGVEFDDACDLRQPDDVLARHVRHVALPEERQHVVLAHREDVDVLDGHHLVVLLVEDGAPQHLARVLLVPLRQERDRTLEPLRGLLEPLPVGVLPDLDQ